MEHKVTLTNCNQQFIVHETETILEAAIRAGISLSYGCSSGTCGLCKAKLLDGSVKEIKTQVFSMPESEKLQSHILTCINTACEDIVLDALIASTAADIPLQELSVKVRKIELIASEVYRLIVQTPRTNRLRFLAGQYIDLVLQDVGAESFAIASCPCEDRLIEFHVRVLNDDPFTEFIATKLKAGDTAQLKGPYGNFVYDENAKRPVILFAFDTGFAAIKSLLEHITAEDKEWPIHLIWMSCSQDGLYMNNLCRSWGDAFDFFTYTGIAFDFSFKQMLSDPERGRETVESHLREAMQAYDNICDHDIYVCAPQQASSIMEKICIEKNAIMKRFFSEPIRGNEDMSCIVSLPVS